MDGFCRCPGCPYPSWQGSFSLPSSRVIKSASPSESSGKQTLRLVRATQIPAAVLDIFQLASTPQAQPIERREGEVRRGAALTTDQFCAAPHIVDHPGRKREVIRIASHLADVKRQRRDEIGHVLHIQFDHQVGRRVLSPKLRFDRVTTELRRKALERV